MSTYTWQGKWAGWKLREIDYVIACVKQGTRSEEEALQRIQIVLNGEKSKD